MSKEFHNLKSDQERWEFILAKHGQLFQRLDNIELMIKGINKKCDGTTEIGQVLLDDIFNLKRVVSNHSEVLKSHNNLLDEITSKKESGSIEAQKEKSQDT